MDTPNYQETTVAGSSWKRSHHVTIQNPYNGLPSVNFGEQNVFVLGDKTITEFAGDTLAVLFSIDNPKHLALYNLLNEIYIEARELRDNPPPPVEPPVEP